MISDEILSAAAGEVAAAMAASVPDCGHVFSRGFERKMEHLIRRAAHPVRHRALRYAAAILIAAITAFGSLYLLSPTVRAAVNGWIKTTYGSYIQYYSENTTPPEQEYEYFLPEEFDGYKLVKELDTVIGKWFLYSDSEGHLLEFEFIYSSQSASIFLEVENCEHSNVRVGDYVADLYLALDPNEHSFLIWTDPTTGTIFSIGAAEDKDFLIAVAEIIEKNQKISN